MRAQLYVFQAPAFGEPSWAWCEMFLEDGRHVTVPTPFRSTTDALAGITRRNPGAVIDELDRADDIADALRYAGGSW